MTSLLILGGLILWVGVASVALSLAQAAKRGDRALPPTSLQGVVDRLREMDRDADALWSEEPRVVHRAGGGWIGRG